MPSSSKTITRAELPKVLRAQMEKSLPYSPDDYALVLRALQLVDGGKTDLVGSMLALYESQVLAFYDPLTHTYFAIDKLPSAAAGMGDSDMLRESVVIHELTHALQDQRFRAGARDLALQKDTDGGLALHALLEGEATLVMLDYVLDKRRAEARRRPRQSGSAVDADVVAGRRGQDHRRRPRRATSPSR